MHRRISRTDRVVRLFMVISLCFISTNLLMTYDTYTRVYIENGDENDGNSPRLLAGDVEYGHNDGGDGVARDLYRRIRVLCWVMTSPDNLQTKANAVKKTWAKRCNKYIFFSSKTNYSFPTIGINLPEGREHLTGKSVNAFRYCYEHFGGSYDWFLKADDDTYIIVENLRYFLHHHSPNENIYFGFKFNVIVQQGYFSGGAGYVLSRSALAKLVNVGLRNPLLCRTDGGAEDAEIGKCLQKLDIRTGDSLDIYGKESFHPLPPINHLLGDLPYWMFNNSFHKIRKGLGCCSDYSVSFHYLTPNDMYLMDYLLYHLRPFGIHRKDEIQSSFF